jgi:SH3-like domain-containing protein
MPVAAAEGDRWTVDRQNVNVRSGPSTSTEVLMTINPGERIVEIIEKGDWYFVEFPDQGARGWVYGPLLTKPSAASAAKAPEPSNTTVETKAEASAQEKVTVAPSPQPADQQVAAPAQAQAQPVKAEATTVANGAPSEAAPAVTSNQEPAAVKSFRDTVSELNSRAVSVAGINLFRDVRSIGGGGVQVLATDTWASVPEAGQTSYMNALFDRWQSVANGLGPLSLQIVDPGGIVMMERSGS